MPVPYPKFKEKRKLPGGFYNLSVVKWLLLLMFTVSLGDLSVKVNSIFACN